jgi:ribosomal protein S18 acetylase RimI-like enzyme
MFFAEEKASEEASSPSEETSSPPEETRSVSSPVNLVSSEAEGFLNMAGSFLVDAFWLNSAHHQLGANVAISDKARTNLIIEQCADLQDKYGAIMGKRLLNCAVVGALDQDTNEMLGVVTVKITILERDQVLESERAQELLKNAVASLGPKERRTYKNAKPSVIAKELLSPDTTTVCVLSNLAVSPKARRRGIAKILCDEVEALAKDWGYDEMILLVESANTPARELYQGKLGYNLKFTKEAEPALRVDPQAGEFIETEEETIVLSKNL